MHVHRIHLPQVHVPHVHLPHPDLRHFARDAAIAAEVALASVVLTGSIEAASHLTVHQGSGASVAGSPAAATQVVTAPVATVVTARIDVGAGAAGPVARVRMPAGGAVTLRVLDAAGATVADLATGAADAAVQQVSLAPGGYRVLASRLGPVEIVGDTAIASSTVVRSELITVGDAGVLTVELAAG